MNVVNHKLRHHQAHNRFNQHPFTPTRCGKIWLALTLLGGSFATPVSADQAIDVATCQSVAGNAIAIDTQADGSAQSNPGCLIVAPSSEINWSNSEAKDFKVKFKKHGDSQCDDKSPDDGKDLDSKDGKLSKKSPDADGCYHYLVKFKDGHWQDPIIIVRQ